VQPAQRAHSEMTAQSERRSAEGVWEQQTTAVAAVSVVVEQLGKAAVVAAGRLAVEVAGPERDSQ
jgi:hypothetical protein